MRLALRHSRRAHPLGEFGIVPSALMFDRLDECTCDEEFPDALSVQVKMP